MSYRELSGEQIRQLINTEQAYEALRAAEAELEQRFRGAMGWKTVKGQDYLYRKAEGAWRSLGRRSAETELAFESFRAGREETKQRVRQLDERIGALARVNRAMGLGRMPWTPARLLRRLDKRGLLGRAVSIVGTHALFAYERLAGVQFRADEVATADIDLLYDSRDRLRLIAPAVRADGLSGLIKSVDASFRPLMPGGFRAANDQGFLVDLIMPLAAKPADAEPGRIGDRADDLTAAELEGLSWLVNCPQVRQTVIDERGFPLLLDVPDPRAFALHKLWVSERPDRDRLKAQRDRAQAVAVTALIGDYLPSLPFDDPALSALPAVLRARAAELIEQARRGPQSGPVDWR